MRTSWNSGLTKETNPSVSKISQTMKQKKLDNFSAWRERMKNEGHAPTYEPLIKNEDLAELIGVTLGDGSIHKYARTDGLRIVSNSENVGFINHYTDLVSKVFNKKATNSKRKNSNATDIRVYEKHISKRMGIPAGARANLTIMVPKWIRNNPDYSRRFLKGLYEAEGSYCVHEATYTHKFIFTNHNQSLLKIVFNLLKELGFNPYINSNRVQLSRKAEISRIIELLEFRKY